ncbi:MAG: lipopolysaccharide transport periplasmic protein LptA [Gammaproteobacteria bacterium RIFCSPHIGHO2_12_FULL_45_12]|nr:MAG: lipopolysaccharide transport periplasmic protein LptA [Gammaproteobacteria bacterium RIFCSPHIGHO2_12_FULL_45_12]
MHRTLNIATVASLLSIAFISPGLALATDQKAKLFIVADTSIYNYKTGINSFMGHVKATQGETHVTADKLTTQNNKQHQIREVIAYGIKHQAHYWTEPKSNEPIMNAYADLIKYYPLDENIILSKNVHVTQGNNSFKGRLVLYNMRYQTIIVPPSENGRAVLVYNPEK